MNSLKQLWVSIAATVVLLVVCCGFYPLVVYAVSQLAFPRQANGSLLNGPDGKPLASALLGQNFNGEKYFNPRPSAAGAAGYDATSSGGSNLGPTSQKLADAVKQRVIDYRKANGLSDSTLVPADAVTASGSGLDPHISVKNALLQTPRIARIRGLNEEALKQLVKDHTQRPDWHVFGDASVNIVTLNLALDGNIK
jgi:potassium-transporting ATPase KdpC subunit